MPISGLVVSFAEDPQQRREAIEAISREPRIESGPLEGRRMAIVLDTASSEEDKQLWNWLGSLPGVVFVDVAMVGFEDAEDAATARPETTTNAWESRLSAGFFECPERVRLPCAGRPQTTPPTTPAVKDGSPDGR